MQTRTRHRPAGNGRPAVVVHNSVRDGRPDGTQTDHTVVPIREHAFPLDPAGERYAVIVEPLARTRVPVVLTVAGVGADAEATPLRLTDAKLATGAALPVPTSDRSALSPCRPAARCGSR